MTGLIFNSFCDMNLREYNKTYKQNNLKEYKKTHKQNKNFKTLKRVKSNLSKENIDLMFIKKHEPEV